MKRWLLMCLILLPVLAGIGTGDVKESRRESLGDITVGMPPQPSGSLRIYTRDCPLDFDVIKAEDWTHSDKYTLLNSSIRRLGAAGRICQALGLTCPGSVKEREGPPEIVLLLDRSGSMAEGGMDSKMEEAIGSFLAKQREAVPEAVCTLIQFDDQYEQVYARKSLADLPRVDIQPRGWTALLDALGRSIHEVAKETTARKVVFVVVTDGLENRSTEYKRGKVFDLIRHVRELHGWEFVYLGANQDAIAVANELGISHSWGYNLSTVGSVVDTAATFTTRALTVDPNKN